MCSFYFYYTHFSPVCQEADRRFFGFAVLRQYRTKSVWRLCTPSACKFPVIFHKNAREYSKYSLRFLLHLTKNLTTHLSHNLCAVLPWQYSAGCAIIISRVHWNGYIFCIRRSNPAPGREWLRWLGWSFSLCAMSFATSFWSCKTAINGNNRPKRPT